MNTSVFLTNTVKDQIDNTLPLNCFFRFLSQITASVLFHSATPACIRLCCYHSSHPHTVEPYYTTL